MRASTCAIVIGIASIVVCQMPTVSGQASRPASRPHSQSSSSATSRSATSASSRPMTWQERIEHARIAGDVDALARIVATGTDEQACDAVRNLGHIENNKAAAAIISTLQDSREKVRQRAVSALVSSAGRRHWQTIAERLKRDPSPKVRAAAAKGLGECYACLAVPALLDALDEDNRTVYYAARSAMARICGVRMNVTHDAQGRAKEKQYYEAFWKQHGETISRYHEQHNKR